MKSLPPGMNDPLGGQVAVTTIWACCRLVGWREWADMYNCQMSLKAIIMQQKRCIGYKKTGEGRRINLQGKPRPSDMAYIWEAMESW